MPLDVLFNSRSQDCTNITVSVARILLKMLLLRTAPQDLPFSSVLLGRIVFLYLLSGLVVLNGRVESSMALAQMTVGIIIVMFFSYLILALLGHKERFVQTVTALAGTGIIFNLMAWPVLRQTTLDTGTNTLSGQSALLMLMLVSWEVIITAHIYRHALNMQLAKTIILSIGLFLISMTLSQLIFPPT